MPFLSQHSIHGGGMGDVMADAVAAAKSVGLCVQCKDILVSVPLQPSYHNVVCSPCGQNNYNYSAAAIAAGPLTYKTDLSHAQQAAAATPQELATFYNFTMPSTTPAKKSTAVTPTPFHMTTPTPPALPAHVATTPDPVPPSQPPATPGAAGSGVSTADIHHADATQAANVAAASASGSSWDFSAPGFWTSTNGYLVMGGAAALVAFFVLGKK